MSKAILILAAMMGCGIVERANAGTIFSDDFESEGTFVILQNNYTSFGNWTVSNGTVDLDPIASNTPRRASSGMATFGNFVDLDGSSSNAGRLTSQASLSLQPGSYILSFRPCWVVATAPGR